MKGTSIALLVQELGNFAEWVDVAYWWMVWYQRGLPRLVFRHLDHSRVPFEKAVNLIEEDCSWQRPADMNPSGQNGHRWRWCRLANLTNILSLTIFSN